MIFLFRTCRSFIVFDIVYSILFVMTSGILFIKSIISLMKKNKLKVFDICDINGVVQDI